jgi:NAD(P)-dependent dehydrogenase (short-subunit alcohol dehydrogenase family)
LRLKGKVALVTGGATSIGREIVRAFVREGAATAFIDIKQEEGKALAAELSTQGRCHFCYGDVTREDDGAAAVREIERLFGPISILVNNAARFVFKSYEATMDDWRASFDVNVAGSSLMTKATVESMKRAGGGAIVNFGSISSFVAQPGMMTYNATKAALVEMTRCMALDLAPFNIRANCICPGYILSPALISVAVKDGKTLAELEKELSPQIIMKRVGRPEEIASCVVFLSSDDASYVTGAYLMADGGLTAL